MLGYEHALRGAVGLSRMREGPCIGEKNFSLALCVYFGWPKFS